MTNRTIGGDVVFGTVAALFCSGSSLLASAIEVQTVTRPAASQRAPASPSRSMALVSHEAVACVLADLYPRIDACFTRVAVPSAQVRFRGPDTEPWYFVSMDKAGGAPDGMSCFYAFLPRPNRGELKAFRYYVVGTDTTTAPAPLPKNAPSASFSARIVERESDCATTRMKVAAYARSVVRPIVVQLAQELMPAMEQAAFSLLAKQLVPTGFNPQGVVGATPLASMSSSATLKQSPISSTQTKNADGDQSKSRSSNQSPSGGEAEQVGRDPRASSAESSGNSGGTAVGATGASGGGIPGWLNAVLIGGAAAAGASYLAGNSDSSNCKKVSDYPGWQIVYSPDLACNQYLAQCPRGGGQLLLCAQGTPECGVYQAFVRANNRDFQCGTVRDPASPITNTSCVDAAAAYCGLTRMPEVLR